MRGTPLFKIIMKKNFCYLISFLSIILISCSGEKKNNPEDKIFIPKDPRTDIQMTRTHEDTIIVMDLANKFLTTLKEKDIEGALDQLNEIDSTGVHPLSNQRRAQLRGALGALPVEEYTIDQIVLFSDNDSEVRYTTQMFKDSIGNQMPGRTKGSLHPHRIDNKWYLTILSEKLEPSD